MTLSSTQLSNLHLVQNSPGEVLLDPWVLGGEVRV